ncbi:hypothetical protein [Embleya sp. NPDC059237]|uniref:hypothetical protein n=1 Tax=Embleya sp. NPDC059237 TaxID=3346784 RepID=UPI00368F2186
MGIRLFVEVLDHAPDALTWRERHVLSVLAETARDDTRKCWPGVEDDPAIAHRMRLPARSSRYEVLQALRSKGVLETVSAGRRGNRAVYRIVELSTEQGPETSDPNSEKGSGVSGPKESERVREPRTQSTPQGPETSDPKPEKGSGNHVNRVREPRTPTPQETLKEEKELPPARADVEQVCQHLADRVADNGSKRPTITAKWRTQARLLIDEDGRTVDQILRAIDWCQDSTFWRSNVMSMPKLREKYDVLRLKAMEERERAAPRPGAGPSQPPSRRLTPAEVLAQAAAELDERDRLATAHARQEGAH